MELISQSVLDLVCEFPFASRYKNRDINLEIAKILDFKGSFNYGHSEEEIIKKYNLSGVMFITIELSCDISLSFNYNNFGEYLTYLSKKGRVFQYRNHKNNAWVDSEQFKSFEGLNVLYTIQEFISGRITENLHEVLEGLSFSR